MGRITGSRSAYGHRISYIGFGSYRLSWTFDTKMKGSRLRWSRTITRNTDKDGALRFAKKWDTPMPGVAMAPPSPVEPVDPSAHSVDE